MNVLVPSSWHLVLRVTLCFIVFYTVLYFMLSFAMGLSLVELLYGVLPDRQIAEGSDPSAVIWLKFCGELAARLFAAALVVYLGVPRYRFALLQDGSLQTGFKAIFKRWLLPMAVLSVVTTIGMIVPLFTQYLLVWLLFHGLFAFAMVHYLMHGVPEAKRLRMVEVI